MMHSADSQLPPWERTTDQSEGAGQATRPVRTDGSATGPDEPNLDNLASIQQQAPAISEREDELSGLEQIFYKDDFFRTVLIGCAGGFGLSTLVILISLELTTLRAAMSEQLGLWWFLVPSFTVVAFTAWTFMLIRVRRYRYTKMLRKEAFEKHRGDTTGEDPPDGPRAEADHDPSQDDWL
ncbi:MAG: hypothetical protein VX641_05055 [Planctomycetota bacterium]|nr:hypothetical protein [Planctomycetota bacterium]